MNDAPSGGPEIVPGFLAGLMDEDNGAPVVHLCARCDSPVDDPLEECPFCAAEWEAETP